MTWTPSEIVIIGDSTCTSAYLLINILLRFDLYALTILLASGFPMRNRARGGLRIADFLRYYGTNGPFTTTLGTFNYLDVSEYGGATYLNNVGNETQILTATLGANTLVYVGHSINDLLNNAPSDPPTGFPCAVEELANVHVALNAWLKAANTGIRTVCGVPFMAASIADNLVDAYTDLALNYKAYGYDYCLNAMQCLLYSPPANYSVTAITGNGTTATYTTATSIIPAQSYVGANVTVTGASNGGFNVVNQTVTAVGASSFSIANATNATATTASASFASKDINAADGTHQLESGHQKMGIMWASLLANFGIGTMPRVYLNVTGITNGVTANNAFTARQVLNMLNNLMSNNVGNNNLTLFKRESRAKYAANNADFYMEVPPGFLFDFNQNLLLASTANYFLPNFTNYLTLVDPQLLTTYT